MAIIRLSSTYSEFSFRFMKHESKRKKQLEWRRKTFEALKKNEHLTPSSSPDQHFLLYTPGKYNSDPFRKDRCKQLKFRQ